MTRCPVVLGAVFITLLVTAVHADQTRPLQAPPSPGVPNGTVPPPPPPPPPAPRRVSPPPPAGAASGGQLPGAIVGTATIRGRVLAADSREPVAGVRVVVARHRPLTSPLLPTAVGNLVALTDARGAFEVASVPAGTVMVGAIKSGYVTTWYGQGDAPAAQGQSARPDAGPRAIEIVDEAVVEGVEIAIQRGAVLAGIVVDGDGDPIAGALVQALRPEEVNGVRRLIADVATADVSDERGEFRVYGLPPGRFALAASVSGTPARAPEAQIDPVPGSIGSAFAFFPAGDVPEFADLVSVAAGAEVAGLTIVFAPRLGTISGRIVAPDGGRTPVTFVMLEQDSAFATGGQSSRTYSVAADGTFSIPKLSPGRYTIRVPASANHGIARTSVDLTGTDVNVTLTLTPGRTISGRIVLVGEIGGLIPFVSVVPDSSTDTDPYTAIESVYIRNAGPFVVRGLPARVRLSAAGGWRIQRIRHQGRDIVDGRFDLSAGDADEVEIVLTLDAR